MDADTRALWFKLGCGKASLNTGGFLESMEEFHEQGCLTGMESMGCGANVELTEPQISNACLTKWPNEHQDNGLLCLGISFALTMSPAGRRVLPVSTELNSCSSFVFSDLRLEGR
jgi:hypothetical protein